jgi:hypothetical protein
MALPLEQATAHHASDFIDAVAEEEAALVDRELGLGAGEELAVQIDD